MELGDDCEAAIAESWAVQFLPDVARIAEGRRRLAVLIAAAENKKFNLLLPSATIAKTASRRVTRNSKTHCTSPKQETTLSRLITTRKPWR